MLSHATLGEIGKRAHLVYESSIRQFVERDHHGDFLVVDVDSGDYEIDSRNGLAAEYRLRAKHPDGQFFLLRVGYPAAVEFKSPRISGGRQ